MICLDTNYLINALIPGTREAEKVETWLGQGEALCTTSICWYEFLCGPVSTEEIEIISILLTGGIQNFQEREAQEAARIWKASGSRRSVRMDSMIAATALSIEARLATNNQSDFALFVGHGLQLTD